MRQTRAATTRAPARSRDNRASPGAFPVQFLAQPLTGGADDGCVPPGTAVAELDEPAPGPFGLPQEASSAAAARRTATAGREARGMLSRTQQRVTRLHVPVLAASTSTPTGRQGDAARAGADRTTSGASRGPRMVAKPRSCAVGPGSHRHWFETARVDRVTPGTPLAASALSRTVPGCASGPTARREARLREDRPGPSRLRGRLARRAAGVGRLITPVGAEPRRGP
jgi:hypothetical protein